MIAVLIGATLTAFVRDPWPLYLFCIVMALLLAYAAWKRQLDPVGLLPFLIPLFGLLQLLLRSTAYAPATRDATLRWFALIAVFTLARRRPAILPDVLLVFATLTAALCIAQLNTSNGKVLWLFDSGLANVYGFFRSRNQFGQLVELALPVALWRCFARPPSWWYAAGAAALLYASAIASTSRAAAILTSAELVLVPLAILIQSPERRKRAVLVLPAVVVLAVGWSAAVGFQATAKRFQEPDAMQGRGDFALSALEMARQHPLTGFGLGTFSYVYPRFARVDYPEFVNYAHNDWAEFAADGGFLFSLAVLALFGAALPRIWKRPWALGLVFIAIHACFDFPLPRICIAGWVFAMLGAVYEVDETRPRPELAGAQALAMLLASAVVAFVALRLGIAGAYFSQDSQASLERAIRWAPDESRYYLRLAQLDSGHAPELLAQAIHLDPNNSEALVDSALEAELGGDAAGAEQMLLRAAQVDRTWLPRWSLVNFYFRQKNAVQFWRWAEQAGKLASARRDFVPLFRLASQMDADPKRILTILPKRAAPLRNFIGYQLENRTIDALEESVNALFSTNDVDNNRPYVLWAIEGFFAHQQPEAAIRLWDRLAQWGWIDRNDADFLGTIPKIQSSFAWKYTDTPGVVVTALPGGGVSMAFNGQQPESCALVDRVIARASNVQFSFRYRTDQWTGTNTGLRWNIESLDGKELESFEITPTGGDLKSISFPLRFRDSAVHLRLRYQRKSGFSRAAGTLDIASAAAR